MDLIKSGSYIDIFYAKTCATTKISTVVGYHVVLAPLLLTMSPRMTKPTKWHVHPAETEHGHLPSLIRIFAVCMKKPWVLSYPLSARQRLWSDWVDAQADLSLRWAHTHFVGFVTRRLNCISYRSICFIKWLSKVCLLICTVMILSFRTDMPGQTVQTQIRLLLEEQSVHGLHCLPFRLHRLDSLLYGRAT